MKNNAACAKTNDLLTFLGQGSELTGVIRVEGPTRIDGSIEGEVHVKGTLVIGKDAVIKGDVSTDTLICSGHITGDVHAAERVRLLAPCVLVGSVHTPVLSVEEGVLLSATCEMVASTRQLDGAPGATHLLHLHEQLPAVTGA